MGDNMDRAMAAATRYRDLYDRGDIALAGQERRTIEELVGAFGDGRFQLPLPVALAMGRRDLGPAYEVRETLLSSNGEVNRRTTHSAHYTREAADSARETATTHEDPKWKRYDVVEVQS